MQYYIMLYIYIYIPRIKTLKTKIYWKANNFLSMSGSKAVSLRYSHFFITLDYVYNITGPVISKYGWHVYKGNKYKFNVLPVHGSFK